MHAALKIIAGSALAAGALALAGCASAGSGEGAGAITDGYTRVHSEERGGYQVTLWQLPERVVVGSVQYGLELRRADTLEAVDNGQVQVYAHFPGAESQKSPLINTRPNPHFYESMLTLERAGDWQIELRGEEPLAGDSIFYEGLTGEERTRGSGGTTAGQLLFGFIIVVLVVIPAFVWWRSRRWRRRAGGAEG